MRATSTLSRVSIAATALLAVAGNGCGDLQAIVQDVLDHHNGSSDGGTGSSDGGTIVSDGGPAGFCKAFAFDVYDQCLSIDQFQSIAKQSCDKQNLVLRGVGLDNDCDGKNAHTGRYTCCTPDVATGSDGGSGPAQSCEKIPDGGGAFACLDYAGWKDRGSAACTARGEALTDLVLSQTCGGDSKSAYSATYVCCGPVAPTPVDKCVRLAGGGGPSSCKPSTTWDAYGAEACSAMGLNLTDIGYSSGCSKTGPDFGDAMYLCCTGATGNGVPKCGSEVGTDGTPCQSCWDDKGVMVSSNCAPLPGRIKP